MIPPRDSQKNPADRDSHEPHEELMIASLTNLISIKRVAALMVCSVECRCARRGATQRANALGVAIYYGYWGLIGVRLWA